MIDLLLFTMISIVRAPIQDIQETIQEDFIPVDYQIYNYIFNLIRIKDIYIINNFIYS